MRTDYLHPLGRTERKQPRHWRTISRIISLFHEQQRELSTAEIYAYVNRVTSQGVSTSQLSNLLSKGGRFGFIRVGAVGSAAGNQSSWKYDPARAEPIGDTWQRSAKLANSMRGADGKPPPAPTQGDAGATGLLADGSNPSPCTNGGSAGGSADPPPASRANSTNNGQEQGGSHD